MFERYRPEVVVSDIIMPHLNGVEMVRKIKEIEPDQPVIFTTANSELSLFVDMVALHVEAYLPKPVDLDVLGESLQKIFRRLEMQERYERQRTILNEVVQLQSNYLAVLDREGNVIFLNDRFSQFLQIDGVQEGQRATEAFWKMFYPSEIHPLQSLPKRLEELRSNTTEKECDAVCLEHLKKSFKIGWSEVEETGHVIVTLVEVTKMMQERRHFERRAIVDELTGLKNRFGFNQKIVEEMLQAIEKRKPLSLIVTDLDFFKSVNDRYGHLVGDEVLVEFARFLLRHAPDGATVARWGGEEFVVLLPGHKLEKAKTLAEKLRTLLHQERLSSHELQLSASFGVARQHSFEETPTTFFERADRALYKAKESGRDRVVTEDELSRLQASSNSSQ